MSMEYPHVTQIRSGLKGEGLVLVRIATGPNTSTTQVMALLEASKLFIEIAKALEEASPTKTP